ncbi:alpha/beta fold hydrolase [Haloechinothrix sp. YIM 98757]|uniref:Alpha/beta fold hydrolase n=1 Tax=Haloechinothrix aidingensis TaxID=2752311 RepID=A0A838AD63_9PSEU|nr:alpha/beta fold hydrolase [Haloechinothrix aidingensis]
MALAALLAGCTSGGEGSERTSRPDAQSRGPAGPVPQGLERFYRQSLSWGDCADFATTERATLAFNGPDIECGRLTVPLDYDEPDGTEITLGVVRRRAGNQDERIGSLIMNPGGPGVAGMPAAASLSQKIAGTALGERFDFVGFDPRGIGASEPQIRCLTDSERDAERADDDETDNSPDGIAGQEADARAFARKCQQRTEHGEAMLANLGTRMVARDMDVLRSVLGDEKLTYLGYSYGTRLGSVYAETYPGNVRAMVLDGAIAPSKNQEEQLIAQAAGFQRAFEQFVDWCVQREDCALGADPSTATQRFQELVRPLIEQPVPAGDGRELSYDDATTATAQALYSRDLWTALNSGLDELTQGQGTSLMRLADYYNERGPDGNYSTTQDAHTAIRCVDAPAVTDRQEILRAERRYEEVAPFLDDGKPDGAALGPCAYWPVPHTLEPHLPDARGLPPVLVVSTTNDPATPYQAGVRLADALGGGLLTFDGTRHTAFLQGNECVNGAATDYLVNLELPPEGKRCT